MITVRKSKARGYMENDWLKSWHSFSFGEYQDSNHIQFRKLRVINQDIIAPEGGFPTHPHHDMEILTYIIKGRLAHKDSEGNVEEITQGEIQRMSAGSGIHHSEFNPSSSEPTELLQIWIYPKIKGLKPGYEQKHYGTFPSQNHLQLLASPDGANQSLLIHQDARVYRGELPESESINYTINPERHLWVQVVKGQLAIDETNLQAGDGASVSDLQKISIQAGQDSEFLLFDLD